MDGGRQPAVRLLLVLHVLEPHRAQQLPSRARLEHFRAASALRRGWRRSTPRLWLLDGREYLAWADAPQGAGAAVLVLPGADRHRHVASVEQLAVPQLPSQPTAGISRARTHRVTVHRRSTAVPLHEGTADGGVQHRRAGVEAVVVRHVRAGAEQRDDVGLLAQDEAALAGTELHARGRPGERHLAHQRAGHPRRLPLRNVVGRVVEHLQGGDGDGLGIRLDGDRVCGGRRGGGKIKIGNLGKFVHAGPKLGRESLIGSGVF